MYTKLDNRKDIPVIDSQGYLVEKQSYRNTLLAELYPDEDIVLIEWFRGNDGARSTVEELMEPVEYNGRKYYGALAWGSAVKRGVTIGLTNDFPVTNGLVKLTEDGQRVGRWLMAQGIFSGFKESV